jgi:molybdopterin converting factor subunit 1
MTVTVQLFARARELANSPVVDVELTEPALVCQLRSCLATRLPALESLLARSMIAVDGEIASDDTPLTPGAEIAILPPVSGG